MDFLSVEKKIEDFISKQVKTAGAHGVVLGLSGGIDSAVVATLAARALGPENVLALVMPSLVTKHDDVDDAELVAEQLEIATRIIPIKDILESYEPHISHDDLAMGNLAARVRMCLLYYHANHFNYLVAGTGNKSEISIGYFTKFGDGGCDIQPIGDLYKTQVFELAGTLGVSRKIVNKKPSAGLWPGQTDEKEIGITYEKLDKMLADRIENIHVKKMVNASEHKREPPKVCKL